MVFGWFITNCVVVWGLFSSVIVVIFQSIFRAKMHQNKFFYFLKIIFKISASK